MATFDVEALGQRIYEALADDFRSACIGTVENLADVCESPIEVLLGAALIGGMNLCNQDFIALPASKTSSLILTPQFVWGNYRIDFCLSLRNQPKVMIFLECDGHDFHERTKEQAARDRKKDRKIQEAGIPVLRFTGSEIFLDPNGCAAQVLDFLNKNIARLVE